VPDRDGFIWPRQVSDVRRAVLEALERDRQMPVGEVQTRLLDGYLAASDAVARGPAAGETLGGTSEASSSAAPSREELRSLLADRADQRRKGSGGGGPSDPGPPAASGTGGGDD